MRGVKITFYGGMTVLLEDESGYKVLMDPYISQNPHHVTRPEEFCDVDLICVTHNANDHYGDTTRLMRDGRAALVTCSDVIARVKRECGDRVDAGRLYGTIYGDDKEFGNVCVKTVLAQHISRTEIGENLGSFAPPLGFIIRFQNGVTYYHSGDTSIFGDMKLIRELYHPDIACLSIDRWKPRQGRVLNPREAAIAASWLGVDVVIPGHYSPGSAAPEEFKDMMRAFAPDAQIRGEMDKPFLYKPYEVISCDTGDGQIES